MIASFREVTFEWPNGQLVFKALSFSIEKRRYGLVGPNGVGKSTLARLLTGDLTPTAGAVRASGVLRFAQEENPPDLTVAEALIDVWDDPAAAAFIDDIPLDLPCRALSGGQWTRVRLAQVFSAGARLLILDEPTNHLDRESRSRFLTLVRQSKQAMLLISHDRELLLEVDEIFELSSRGLQKYGGNWDFYDSARTAERERAAKTLDDAKRERDRAQAERAERKVSRDRQNRHGKVNAEKKGLPKIVLGAMKRRAEVTTGRIDAESSAKFELKIREAHEALENIKAENILFLNQPELEIPETEIVFFTENFSCGYPDPLWQPLSLTVRGPRKVAVTGPNGAGKSTFLRLLAGDDEGLAKHGFFRASRRPTALVSQIFADLQDQRSVLDHLREVCERDDSQLRDALARFLFRGDAVFQPVSALSGGEKLRLALARALLRSQPASLLLLDEPTNHLDLDNVEFLERFLKRYPGVVVVVSHDEEFLKRIGVDLEIALKRESSRFREIPHPHSVRIKIY